MRFYAGRSRSAGLSPDRPETRRDRRQRERTWTYVSVGAGEQQVSGRSGRQRGVASRSPGTCSESLWLLPSGPDQVHDLAMRGDPPLIGAQLPRTRSITAHRSAGRTCRGDVCGGLRTAARAVRVPRLAENGFLPLGGTVDCPSPSKGYNGRRRLRRGAASATTSGVPRSPWQGCANARRHQDRRKPSTTRPETGRWTMRDRVFVRRLRSWCRRSLIGLAALSLLAFSGCESTRPPLPPGKPGLHVVVRPGPSTWFTLPDGTTTGFDHDLLTRFARERGVPLHVTFADGAAPLLDEIAARRRCTLGAGGLFQAADARQRRPRCPASGVGVEHRLPLRSSRC